MTSSQVPRLEPPCCIDSDNLTERGLPFSRLLGNSIIGRADPWDPPVVMRSSRPISASQRFASSPARQLMLAAILLLIASIVAAWSAFQPHGPEYSLVRVTAAIAFGPIGGWWGAWQAREIARAFPLLIMMTAAATVPFGVWIRRPRHSGLLGLAIFVWFFAGYYFAVGMWM